MSDPAASVKSIVSGRIVNEDDPNGHFDQNYTTKITSSDSLTSETNANEPNSLYIPSPSLSRNSTTSCLSTTATKDGIEGRRIHRTGPNAYSNQIISNLIKNQNHKYNDSSELPAGDLDPSDDFSYNSPIATPQRSPSLEAQTPPAADTPMSEKFNFSQSSLQTTDAQIDGERGHNVDVLGDQPSLSLNAKLSLLNKE